MPLDCYTFMKLSTNIRLGYAQNMMRHETSVPNKRLIKIAEVPPGSQSTKNPVKDYLKEIRNVRKAQIKKMVIHYIWKYKNGKYRKLNARL
tara:strand:+ start:222 stop:494 length:273 start_codon:yes stop_codon:yes gene_type:complete